MFQLILVQVILSCCF